MADGATACGAEMVGASVEVVDREGGLAAAGVGADPGAL